MYADDAKRTPKTVLRLHNTTLLHAIACLELFSQPRHKHILHTRFLHSIVCHAPLLFRIISLRSVNAEAHERMFGQMKQITKATSNYDPNNVNTNALIRMHEEGKDTGIDTQESEVGKIAQTLGRKRIQSFPTAGATPTPHNIRLTWNGLVTISCLVQAYGGKKPATVLSSLMEMIQMTTTKKAHHFNTIDR